MRNKMGTILFPSKVYWQREREAKKLVVMNEWYERNDPDALHKKKGWGEM